MVALPKRGILLILRPVEAMHLILIMINGLGQMALITVLFGLALRTVSGARLRPLVVGLLFGWGAAIAMLNPAIVADGILIDTSTIMLGIGAAFGGVAAGIAAAAVAIVSVGFIGGAGVPAGILGIVTATTAGIVWRTCLGTKRTSGMRGLAVLGLGVALHSLVVVVAFPGKGSSLDIALYLLSIGSTCVVATLALGWMMRREISLVQRERALSVDAMTDPLTGIANRRAFDRGIDAMWTGEALRSFALVLIDVDHFKRVNDRYGHDAGDVALAALAGALGRSARHGDIVARFGGEEFVMLLPDAELGTALAIAERLRRTIAALPVELADSHVALTASFGVATSQGRADGRAVLAAADLALYRAKELGRNRVEFAPTPSDAPLSLPRHVGAGETMQAV